MKCMISILCIMSFVLADDQTQNAAVIYWKATALTTKDLDEKHKNSSQFAQMAQNGELGKLFSNNETAIREVTKASKLSHCRFVLPTEYKEGGDMLLPHLAKMMELSRLVVLSGLHCASQKNWETAGERYLTAMRFSHHLSQDPILISYLVSYASLGMSLSAIRNTHLHEDFPQDLAKATQQQLGKMLPDMNLNKPFKMEAQYFLAPYREKLQRNDLSGVWQLLSFSLSGEHKEFIDKLAAKDTFPQAQDVKKLASLFGVPTTEISTREKLAQYMTGGLDAYVTHAHDIAAICQLPYRLGKQKYQELKDSLSQKHFCVRFISPMATYETQLRMHANIAMTSTLLQLISRYRQNQNFPESLPQRTIGMYSSDDLQYQKQGSGFVLELDETVSGRKFVYTVTVKDDTLHWDCRKYVGEKISEQEKYPR
ncbi:hypothetical protein [Candidatus Uabimicrobium amorphum]|uniref:Uncharacterized protein n=1 Tax=Uabimicrobium amorphum TaxID=2596890 RepID=A0A5S9F433_UABAM|nr:hypothetical protein [Candidatus Uabimicrobium amorphum]BBM85385.1 hypothetical protein UABAM_03752 [Candidatus Uabimicrobium amorphum]